MKRSEFMTEDTDGKTIWVELRETFDGPNPSEVVIRKIFEPGKGFVKVRSTSFPNYSDAVETFSNLFRFYVLEVDRFEQVPPISLG